jgi:tetratricopeptide (TPR) repeat protein
LKKSGKAPVLIQRILIVLSFSLAVSLLGGCASPEPPMDKKAQALEDLGNALVREGKLREGLQNLLEAYKIDPDDADLNHVIALTYRELGQFDYALKHFERALFLRPRFPDAQNNLGTLYLIQGQWDAAIAACQKAVDDVLYRTPHFAYNNMGTAYYYKGDLKNAIIHYQKAIQNFPAFSLGYKNLGIVYEANGNLKEAVEAYSKAIEYSTPEDPEHPATHFFLGKLYLKMGRKKEAKELLVKAIEFDPKAPYVEEAKRLLNSIKP